MIEDQPADNLFAALTHTGPDEAITSLLTAPNVRIERIVSTGRQARRDSGSTRIGTNGSCC